MNNLGGVYTTGTLTIAADRINVTGTGTMWGPIGEIGDWILVAGQVGLILTVTDDTHITLQSPWQGTLPAGANYVLIKMSWLRYEPALTQAKLRELLAELEGAGNFIFTDVAPPDPAIGNDGDWALKTNEQPWQVWFKTGGVWVEQRPPGFVWQGPWNAATTYGINDVTQRFGSSYVAVLENINKPPESSPEWNLMAASGAASIAPSSIEPVHLNADTPLEQTGFRDRLNFVTRDAAGDTMLGGLTAKGTGNSFGSGVGLNTLSINGGASLAGPVIYYQALGSIKIATGFQSAIVNAGYDEAYSIWMAGSGFSFTITQGGRVWVQQPIVSTNPTTGSLVVAGGVGIGGALNITGSMTIAPNATNPAGPSLYNYSASNTLTLSGGTSGIQFNNNANSIALVLISNDGRVAIANNSASTSPTTGALTVAGGVGISGSLDVGGELVGRNTFYLSGPGVDGTRVAAIISNVSNVTINTKVAVDYYVDSGVLGRWLVGRDLSATVGKIYIQTSRGTPNVLVDALTIDGGNVAIPANTASTSPTTGALIVAGGVGLSGSLYAAGNVVIQGPQPWIILDRTSTFGANLYGKKNGLNRWALSVANNSAEGGGNTGSDFVITAFDDTGVTSSVAMTIMRSTGQANLFSTVAASNETTGALTVAGGVGIVGRLYVGNNIIARGAGPTIFADAVSGDPAFQFWTGGVKQWRFVVPASSNSLWIEDADGSHGVALAQNTAAWGALSDRRLPWKETREPISVLDRIADFELWQFERSGRVVYGGIAQDVDRVFPGLVVRGADDDDRELDTLDPGTWSVMDAPAGMLALGGLKELAARLAALESRFNKGE